MSSNFLQQILAVRPKALPVLILSLLVLAPARSKADTAYSSLASFNAAAGSTTTITFNGIAPTNSFVNEPSPLTLSGASFSSASTMFVIDPGYYGFSSYTGGGFFSADYTVPDIINVALPSGTTAVGFNFGGLLGTTGSFLVTLSDGFTTTLTTTDSTAGGSLAFAGFTTSSPISSITIDMPDSPDYNALDNFVFGHASVTPEPTTFGLVLTGLLGAAGAVRRRIQA